MTKIELEKILASGDEDRLVEALYTIGSLADVPSWVRDIDRQALLKHPNPDVRERAMFIFGIKQKDQTLCNCFVDVVMNEDVVNTPNISAALLSLGACGCMEVSPQLLRRLLFLLDCDNVNSKLGYLIYGWILHAVGAIDTRTYLLAYGPKNGPVELKKIAELKARLAAHDR